jgi:type II secretory pathway pseudopilin PulG
MNPLTSRVRAFTLIELMIAIVGVCAALAVYGVGR